MLALVLSSALCVFCSHPPPTAVPSTMRLIHPSAGHYRWTPLYSFLRVTCVYFLLLSDSHLRLSPGSKPSFLESGKGRSLGKAETIESLPNSWTSDLRVTLTPSTSFQHGYGYGCGPFNFLSTTYSPIHPIIIDASIIVLVSSKMQIPCTTTTDQPQSVTVSCRFQSSYVILSINRLSQNYHWPS